MPIVGEGRLFTCVRCASNEEWLEQRTKGVGGSDVAAILGVSPWKTVASLWMEKTGRVKPEDISDKPYVRFGNDMEPLIRRWYEEKYPDRKVRRVNAICQSIERPWAQASLDFEVHDPELGWGVLEMKTARNAKDWEDGVPDHYAAQVTHYVGVTGRPFADVCVFFRDTCEYEDFRLMRDEEDVEYVSGMVDQFWNEYVLRDVMPALVGTAGEAKGLVKMYGSPDSDIAEVADDEIVDLVRAYVDAKEREDAAKADKVAASTRLQGIIAERKGVQSASYRVTWTRTRRTNFDAKRFKAEHPDLYEQYAKTRTQSGGLRIKELSER